MAPHPNKASTGPWKASYVPLLHGHGTSLQRNMEVSDSPSRESERNRNKERDEGRTCAFKMCLDMSVRVFPRTRGKSNKRGSQHGVSRASWDK